MVTARPEASLEEVLELFASGTLEGEVSILDTVGGKRIAIAPAAGKERTGRPAGG